MFPTVSPKFRELPDGRRLMLESDALPTSSVVLPVGRELLEVAGPPQSIRVFDTGDSRGRAMDIDGIVMLTERDEAFFHETLVHVPAGTRFSDGSWSPPKRALVVGGGDGGSVREICRYPEVESVTVCEYDERVVRASREFFPDLARSFDDPRVRTVFRDAVEYVRECPDAAFDLVVIDGNGPFPEMDGTLFSSDFYRQIARIMGPDARASTFAGTPVSDPGTYVRIVATLRGIFPFAEPYLGFVPMYDTGCWGNVLLSRRAVDLSAFAPLPPEDFRYVAPRVREASFVLPAFARV